MTNAPYGKYVSLRSYSITVIDALGKTLLSKVSNLEKGSNAVSLDEHVAAGIYFISIGNEFNTVNGKVFVR